MYKIDNIGPYLGGSPCPAERNLHCFSKTYRGRTGSGVGAPPCVGLLSQAWALSGCGLAIVAPSSEGRSVTGTCNNRCSGRDTCREGAG